MAILHAQDRSRSFIKEAGGDRFKGKGVRGQGYESKGESDDGSVGDGAGLFLPMWYGQALRIC